MHYAAKPWFKESTNTISKESLYASKRGNDGGGHGKFNVNAAKAFIMKFWKEAHFPVNYQKCQACFLFLSLFLKHCTNVILSS